jgi:RimJ/RimL family protein N-acetyltransferase
VSIADVFPVLGLRVRAGDLELRGITDADLVPLGELARRGVHAPDRMPFYVPWTQAPAHEQPLNMAQYQWMTRARFSPTAWSLNLGVWVGGELVGVQGLDTSDFLVTRTGETGSWLGLAHQGRGTGTRMRQAICALAFDHLDATELTSGAFLDNPASIAVSRKVGYAENGVTRKKRRDGEVAEHLALVLRPETFVRGEPIEVDGVGPVRRLLGLDEDDRTDAVGDLAPDA